MKNQDFAFDFPATQLGVRKAMVRMMSRLRCQAHPSDLLSAIEISVTEATNNIAEHGYPEHEHGRIKLSITVLNDRINVEIRDSGHAYPNGEIPSLTRQDLTGNTCDLPEGGFGWLLIHELAREITYERTDHQNHLRLSF